MTPNQVWHTWTFQPVVVAGLATAAFLYWRGVRALWSHGPRGRGVRPWQLASFGTGLTAVFAALVSPLDALAEQVLWGHMVQHLLLITVGAPLLVLGAPVVPMTLALPASWRPRAPRWEAVRWVETSLRPLTHPVTTWLLAGAALWIWHLPSPYQAALRNPSLHALEHATFLGTALLFWWTAFHPSGRRRLALGADVLYVFTGAFQGAVLGAVLTFATVHLYPFYTGRVAAFGLTPLQDQQLAGVVMWIPSGVVYLLAAGVLFVRWFRAMDRQARRSGSRTRGTALAPPLLLVCLAVAVAFAVSACASTPGRTPPPQVPGGRPNRGAQAIKRYGCGSCHVIPGIEGAAGKVGPPLNDFSERGYIAGELPNNGDNLVRWIMDPRQVEPGTDMPDLGVDEAQARDIAAYLFTLR